MRMQRLTVAALAALPSIVLLSPFSSPSRAAAFAGEMVWIAGGGDGDGAQAIDVEMSVPVDVAIDSDGSVLVAERGSARLQRVRLDGTVETIVPAGDRNGEGNGGPASGAGISLIQGVAADATSIYFVDDQEIRRIDKATGIVDRFAGNGVRQFNGNGPVATTSLGSPAGVAVDGSGGLLVAETWNSRVRRVAAGTVTGVAGTGAIAYGGDGGSAANASLNQPYDIARDAAGNLYVADTENNRIRVIDTAGVITTVAGTGSAGFSGDNGPAVSAMLNRPTSVAVGGDGTIYISDTGNRRVRAVSPAGTVTTIAGNGTAGSGGDGSNAALAQLSTPRGIAIDLTGRLLIADGGSGRVRRVELDGTISTFAGNGRSRFSVTEGTARESVIGNYAGLLVEADGTVLVGDGGMIRRIGSDGSITRFAGIGDPTGFSGDGGQARDAGLVATSLAADAAGNRYVTDRQHHVIRKIDPAGIITTIAGNGTDGFSGDGGPATGAQLAYPAGIAVDIAGNVYIADTYNNRIRRVDPSGTITTIAGNGSTVESGDNGPATAAGIELPYDVAVDLTGNLVIAGSSIRRVDVATGIVTTLPGVGGGFGSGVAVDSAGNLYIAAGDLTMVTPAGVVTVLVAASDTRQLTIGGSPASAVEAGDLYDVQVASNGDLYVLGHYSVADIGYVSESWLYRIENVAAADLRTYVPTTPTPQRIVDTRLGLGAALAPLAAGVELGVTIAGSHGTDLNAAAVVVNITAVNSGTDGYVSAYPCGQRPQPITSNLNQAVGRIVANAAIVRLGTGGSICLISNVTTDIVVDLQGWYPAATDFKPTTPPVRLADTRISAGITTRLEPGQIRALPIAARNGVHDDATAVALNITATDSAAAGYITAFPCGTPIPLASNLNTWPGHAIANLAITKIGDNGSVCFTSNVATDLVVDMQGWYPLSTNYRSIKPTRVLDTRELGSKIEPFTPVAVPVAGEHGIPADATTASVNITAVDSGPATYVTAYPCGNPTPVVSNNNTSPDRIVATAAIVPIGDAGSICIIANQPVDIVIDIEGWHHDR